MTLFGVRLVLASVLLSRPLHHFLYPLALPASAWSALAAFVVWGPTTDTPPPHPRCGANSNIFGALETRSMGNMRKKLGMVGPRPLSLL